MKILSYKKHGITFYTVWFAKEPIKESGIIQYRQAEIAFDDSEKFITLQTNLNRSEDEIIGQFAKNCRYEVNRAQREGVVVEIYDHTNLNQTCLDEFLAFFLDFWKSKGVVDYKIESAKMEIENYMNHSAFVLSKAKYGKDTIVYHTYFVDDENARLLHSASLYRDDDAVSANLIGMANRYLHKEDIMYFKKNGLATYDWGGAGIEKEVENITKFKESFGGTRVIQYNARVHQGIFATLFKLLIEKK